MKLTNLKSWRIVFLLLLITGCSSAPIMETSYYLLNNQQSIADVSHSDNLTKKNDTTILLDLMDLSEYLSQPYLVMQLDDHQLHYARFHMWAEPLLDGISKALLVDLNKNDSGTQFIIDNQKIVAPESEKLHLQIESFHATSDSKVTLSGRYWLQHSNSDKREVRRPFYLVQKLQHDGYPHSVAKMRYLITELANQILEHIN